MVLQKRLVLMVAPSPSQLDFRAFSKIGVSVTAYPQHITHNPMVGQNLEWKLPKEFLITSTQIEQLIMTSGLYIIKILQHSICIYPPHSFPNIIPLQGMQFHVLHNIINSTETELFQLPKGNRHIPKEVISWRLGQMWPSLIQEKLDTNTGT